MRAKLKIIRYRKRWPLKSSYKIAQEVGVSRQYVHKILKQADLTTSVPRHTKIYTCIQCDSNYKRVKNKGSKSFCSSICKHDYYHVKVKCSFCRVIFRRLRGHLTRGLKQGYTHLYCSPTCRNKGGRERAYRNQ